ncbi:hypothetical protein CEW92_01955 [Bacillaceae bacterium SAS-127]|nr:hypothetical protein CEW92_01955 [Bacillaceae bacterium SAS-127]
MLGILFALLWSSAAIATKFGLYSTTPLALATIRLLLAGSLLFVYIYLIKKKYRWPRLHEWKPLIILGIGMLAMAIGSVYFKKVKLDLPNIVINTWQVIIGGVLLVPITYTLESETYFLHTDNYLLGSLIWLVLIISIATMLLWFYLLKQDADEPPPPIASHFEVGVSCRSPRYQKLDDVHRCTRHPRLSRGLTLPYGSSGLDAKCLSTACCHRKQQREHSPWGGSAHLLRLYRT